MKLEQALRTGRPIRRSRWFGWYVLSESHRFSREDVLAGDWEVEPEPEQVVEITLEQFKDAYCNHGPGDRAAFDQNGGYGPEIAEALGFKSE